MRLEFALTQEDLAELRIIVERDKRLKAQKWKSTLFCVFCIGLGVALAFVMKKPADLPVHTTPVDPQVRTSNLIVFWSSLVVVIGVLVWLTVIMPRRRLGKILWDNLPGIRLPQIIEITDEQVTKSTSESTSIWKWDLFSGCEETDRLIQLSFGKTQSILIPKRALSSDQLDSLHAMVQQRMKRA